MVLLILQRLANFCVLKHWAMVISTAFYSWGAKDTVAHVTKFLGITVAQNTCNPFFTELTLNHVDAFGHLLAQRSTGLIVRDNFQRGQDIQDQRDGRSSKFLIGTVEAAHRVIPIQMQRWNLSILCRDPLMWITSTFSFISFNFRSRLSQKCCDWRLELQKSTALEDGLSRMNSARRVNSFKTNCPFAKQMHVCISISRWLNSLPEPRKLEPA